MTPVDDATRLVVATRNRGKLAELGRILADLPVELVAQDELGLPEVPETGTTFDENARLKALGAATASGLPAVADDSGIEVDALAGAPGVRSARYAGDGASDADNLDRLLRELVDVPDDGRTARFVCVATLALPDGRTWSTRGVMEGRVIHQPRGTAGFGYDPVFVSVGETRTNAELPPDVKDATSHRGAAFRALRPLVLEALAL